MLVLVLVLVLEERGYAAASRCWFSGKPTGVRWFSGRHHKRGEGLGFTWGIPASRGQVVLVSRHLL